MHKAAKKEKSKEKETVVSVSDPAILQTLVGEADANLKFIERELDVVVRHSNGGLAVSGDEVGVDLGSDLLFQLADLIAAGEELFPGDMGRALKMLAENRRAKLKDLFRDQIKIAGRKRSIVPKTLTQKTYIESIKRNDVVFGVGPAGTGKTYLAMAMAVNELNKKTIRRVVLCRPAVEAGEKLGFLPGDMAEKVNPYLRPLYDALHDMVEIERAEEMIEKGVIEVAPLAFMRGRTLKDAFIILDEAQNTTPEQMKMFLTRMGMDSKCVVTGDITQIDLPRGNRSGLVEAIAILKGIPGIDITYFTKEDVIRHPLVSRIVDAYDSRKDRNSDM